MSVPSRKRPRDPIPTGETDEWRVVAHYPGLRPKYIVGFASKAEAEAWASGPEAQAWINANYQASE
jgi:hypothetical protein